MLESKQSKGGQARARKLSKEKLSAIGRQGADARWKNTIRATHYGELHIGNSVIPCAVLEDGRRVLTREGFLQAIGRSGKPSKDQISRFEDVPVFFTANNLKPFVEKELLSSTTPILFTVPGGSRAYGFPAELLPKVAEVYLKARDAAVLTKNQKPIARACDILMRGLAHVGIIALVDEATGFQRDRAREALEKILDAFIKDELGKWAKRFPDEFYAELFRLKGLKWPLEKNPPQYVGHWTNNLVYKRLAPGILDELKAKTPKTPKGNKKNRYHQWFTEDIGHPKLREHVFALIALMKSSDEWEEFEQRLNRALPKYEHMSLFDDVDTPAPGL